jgi:bromodomain-containing protein 7/9
MFTKVLEYLIAMLERKDMTNFFSQPVSDTFAPGYSQLIKEPMDFSTMNEKIEDNKYENLHQFRRDFELICKNCMMYNTPETVYHKAAKRLLHAGQRILLPGRLRALAENHLPMIQELSLDLLGFDIKTELPGEMTHEEERDISKIIAEIRGSIRRPANRFEAIPDNMTPEEIASQASNAANGAANRLKRRRPGSNMGYLRQNPDGTTSLSIVTPSSVVVEGGEKTVTLGQLIGRVKNGATALQGFKEDRRNVVKAFNPIYYGAFSSYGPAYDSTFANLTKQETELVYNTYGDDVGVAYAESIKNFSKNCEYATFIVDNLLDILTGNEHKKTSKYIEEQKLLRSEESLVKAAFQSSDNTNSNNNSDPPPPSSTPPSNVDFDSLRSLAKDGIDMSFLESLQTQYTKLPTTRLDKNAVLLESLRDVQHQRLSGPPPQHLGQMTGPSNEESAISERVQQNLVSLVADTRPTDVFIQGGWS